MAREVSTVDDVQVVVSAVALRDSCLICRYMVDGKAVNRASVNAASGKGKRLSAVPNPNAADADTGADDPLNDPADVEAEELTHKGVSDMLARRASHLRPEWSARDNASLRYSDAYTTKSTKIFVADHPNPMDEGSSRDEDSGSVAAAEAVPSPVPPAASNIPFRPSPPAPGPGNKPSAGSATAALSGLSLAANLPGKATPPPPPPPSGTKAGVSTPQPPPPPAPASSASTTASGGPPARPSIVTTAPVVPRPPMLPFSPTAAGGAGAADVLSPAPAALNAPPPPPSLSSLPRLQAEIHDDAAESSGESDEDAPVITPTAKAAADDSDSEGEDTTRATLLGGSPMRPVAPQAFVPPAPACIVSPAHSYLDDLKSGANDLSTRNFGSARPAPPPPPPPPMGLTSPAPEESGPTKSLLSRTRSMEDANSPQRTPRTMSSQRSSNRHLSKRVSFQALRTSSTDSVVNQLSAYNLFGGAAPMTLPSMEEEIPDHFAAVTGEATPLKDFSPAPVRRIVCPLCCCLLLLFNCANPVYHSLRR
jgi:hypothetical protein